MSIGEIAQKYGIGDMNYFTKVFKKVETVVRACYSHYLSNRKRHLVHDDCLMHSIVICRFNKCHYIHFSTSYLFVSLTI